jgi:hypothetical protein
MLAYKKSGLSMEVEINVKTIYRQALDHRDDHGRKDETLEGEEIFQLQHFLCLLQSISFTLFLF